MSVTMIDSKGTMSCFDCGELPAGTNPVKHSCIEFLKERITTLEETNRLLCRDLDEAQRTIEELRGISV